MRVGIGTASYEWVDRWAKIPPSDSARLGWAHHGVAVSKTGEVISFHQGDPTMLVFDPSGRLERTWNISVADAHGITLVEEGGTEFLWIADNGRKRQYDISYEYPQSPERFSGKVVKTTLDGEIVMELEKPDLEIYRGGNYSPTFVVVNEQQAGGDGDVWVADGYGENHVHQYTKNGDYVGSINGSEGTAGLFNCPHAIFIDRRRPEAELYVADRTNKQVQVYTLDGNFKRSFGSEFLSSPSGFVTDGDRLVVAELRARLAVLDQGDNLICYLGENEEVCRVDGWPNNRDSNGDLVPTNLLEAGKFNSPHGMAIDGEGNLYVAEWLIGGRFTKLAKG